MKTFYKGIIILILVSIYLGNNDANVVTLIMDKVMDYNVNDAFKIWHHIFKTNEYSAESNDYTTRFEIFKLKFEEIKLWNANENNNWKKGLNKFSDWTKDEFRNTYLNNLEEHVQQPLGGEVYYAAAGLINFDQLVPNSPVKQFTAINWSDKTGSVDDQGKCGSCYAFATLNAIETSYFIKTGTRVKLSRQQIVDCNPKTQGCNGGWASNVAVYAKVNGVMLESDYPYTGEQGDCKYNSSKAGMNYITGISGHKQPEKKWTLKKYSPNYLYQQLKNGPVVVGIDGDSLSDYKSGIFNPEGCLALNHAVLVTGFGFDSLGTPYWIIKNSWGSSFGENGYFRFLAREFGADSTGNCYLYYYPYRPFYNGK